MTNHHAVEQIIKEELQKLKKQQINLGSAAATAELAMAITRALTSKFYLVSYSTQESFE